MPAVDSGSERSDSRLQDKRKTLRIPSKRDRAPPRKRNVITLRPASAPLRGSTFLSKNEFLEGKVDSLAASVDQMRKQVSNLVKTVTPASSPSVPSNVETHTESTGHIQVATYDFNEITEHSDSNECYSGVCIRKPDDVWDEVIKLIDYKAEELKSWMHLRRLPQKPKLVLSVIGDSNCFVPKPWRTSVLKTGLIETCKGAKDCLILYKGSTEKISTLVRDAVESFHSLCEDDNDNFISLVGLMPETNLTPKMQSNERNHWEKSECVIGDMFELKSRSANGKPEAYAEFYSRILESISTKETHLIRLKKDLVMRVPVLTIVAGGDLETLNAIHKILQKGLPVLILKGSGNASDFIAEFTESNMNVEEFIEEKTALLLGIIRQDANETLKNSMSIIKTNTSLVTVIDIENQTNAADFKDAVVRAIIRGWSKDIKYTTHGYVRENVETDTEDLVDKLRLYEDIGRTTPPSVCLPSSFSKIKVHPTSYTSAAHISVTRNVITENTQDVQGFMKKYQEYLSPASLPLYYYMAYQFIQEIDGNKNEKEKEENFQILLKEAIIADQVDYVSVLLEEGVKFDPGHFPDIYEETILRLEEMGDDFQHILKWGPSKAILTLKRACAQKKLEHTVSKLIEDNMSISNAAKHITDATQKLLKTSEYSLSNGSMASISRKLSTLLTKYEKLETGEHEEIPFNNAIEKLKETVKCLNEPDIQADITELECALKILAKSAFSRWEYLNSINEIKTIADAFKWLRSKEQNKLQVN